jgi:ATP-binding cassette subfamily G (WHITE) protein 2 (PDR)
LNPIAYAFESLMINEFRGREFRCSDFVPSGSGYVDEGGVGGLERSCRSTGSVPGSAFVDGDRYINENFAYYAEHKWRCEPPPLLLFCFPLVSLLIFGGGACRNLGIVIPFWIFFTFTYLLATAKIQAAKSKGEVLVFKRGYIPRT